MRVLYIIPYVSHTSDVSGSRHAMITIATTVHGFSLDNIKANKF